MRVRLGLALPLIAALVAGACGGLGVGGSSVCPAPTLEPVRTPGGAGYTATMPAIMHFLSGEADVTLSSDRLNATAGSWIYMPAQLPHSISAKTPLVMLLLLLKQGAAKT